MRNPIVYRVLVAFYLLVAWSLGAAFSPAAGQPCHELAREALIAGILSPDPGGDRNDESDGLFGREAAEPTVVIVKKADPALWRCLEPIERRPAGSENWPVVGRVGLVLQGAGSPEELLPFLRGENDWGLNGGEGKSEIYGAWNPAAMLAWWNLRLRDERHGKVRAAVRRFLRAVWTMHAIGLYEREPEAVIAETGGRERRRAGGRTNYRGPVLHHPGMRSAVQDAHWVEASPLNGLTAAALGLRWRSTRPIEKLARGREYRSWPQAVVQHVISDLQAPTRAEAWGLTEEERKALALYVRNPTLEGAEALLPWLEGYGHLPGVETVWIRLAGEGGGGALVSYQTRSTNHVKAGQGPWMIAAAAGPQAWRLAPLPLERADDLPSVVHERPGGAGEGWALAASSKAGAARFPLPRFGRELFRVVQAPEGWRVTRPAPAQ